MNPLETQVAQSFWAIIAVDGQRFAARLGEQALFNATFVRADILDGSGCEAFTRFYQANELRSITPVDEATARQAAAELDVREAQIRVYVSPALALPASRAPAPPALEDNFSVDQRPDGPGAPPPDRSASVPVRSTRASHQVSPRKLQPELVRSIGALTDQGYGPSQVAAELGIGYSTAQRYQTLHRKEHASAAAGFRVLADEPAR